MLRLIFFLLLFIPSAAFGLVLIDVDMDSAPSSEDNGGVYTGDVSTISLHVTGGGNMFDHITGSSCWGGSGGCGRFNMDVGQGGVYRGFNPGSYSGGATQLNFRYLARWNAYWDGADNLKGNYITLGGSPFWTQEKGLADTFGAAFQMAFSHEGTLYQIHGNGYSNPPCSDPYPANNNSGYHCCVPESTCDLGPGVAAAGPFYFHDYDDEWVAFEIEMHSNGSSKLYIWTQDGVYDGLYMHATNNPTGTPGVTGFGGSYYNDGNVDSGATNMVDEVVFADAYIGPPTGFTEGDSTPPAVSITTTDPSNINTDTLAISGTSSDANGVDECKWRVGAAPGESSGTSTSGTTAWSATASGFSEGENTLYVGCADPSNNWGSNSIVVNLTTLLSIRGVSISP